MSFRRSDDPRKKDDDVESQIPRSLGSNKSDHDYNKRLRDEQLREQESFISRSYWLCTCLFAVSFVAMGYRGHTRCVQGCRIGREYYGERPRNHVHGALLCHVLLLQQPDVASGYITLRERIHRSSRWVPDGH